MASRTTLVVIQIPRLGQTGALRGTVKATFRNTTGLAWNNFSRSGSSATLPRQSYRCFAGFLQIGKRVEPFTTGPGTA